MSARFFVPVAILASGPIMMLLAWPWIADHVRLADLAVAVVTQPRDEVVVTGYLKNDQAPAFSIESITIEEPGKEPYRRMVSLDAARTFELALGRPVAGSYRVAAWTRKANWPWGQQERWLRAPELVIKSGSPLEPRQVRAQDFDYGRLLVFGALVVATQAACLIVWYRCRSRSRVVISQ